MGLIDWIVLCLTLGGVIWYGVYKGRGNKNLKSYFKSNNSLTWLVILLSIMGTQASAITFLSAPGQAYTDGMRFVQYYFGLPIAMVVLCFTLVPIYHRLKVYTAYEYLEERFDLKTRMLASLLFLLQRGLSTGISIYAPSIILSSLLGWNIYLTNVVMGGLLIIYTVTGGAKAVAYTQVQQLIVVFLGLFLAAWMILRMLPDAMNMRDALKIAGALGKMNVIVTDFEPSDPVWWKDRYNLWSGLIGGFFLAMSYFGTDQSQVGRYIGAKSLRESRMGLLMNGLVKVPMQFGILLIGVLVFVFYLHFKSPLLFNEKLVEQTMQTPYRDSLLLQEKAYASITLEKKQCLFLWQQANTAGRPSDERILAEKLKGLQSSSGQIVENARRIIRKAVPLADTNDTNYIFLYFVIHHLPVGLVGLLIAVIFLSAWGSIAAALNSLSGSTVIDLYQRIWAKHKKQSDYFRISEWVTFFWGLIAIGVAMFATRLGSLIEAVNILGSLFYGTILGIFMVAFYLKCIGGHAVFYAAVISEIAVIGIYAADVISFLWLNVIGCLLVMLVATVLSLFLQNGNKKAGLSIEKPGHLGNGA